MRQLAAIERCTTLLSFLPQQNLLHPPAKTLRSKTVILQEFFIIAGLGETVADADDLQRARGAAGKHFRNGRAETADFVVLLDCDQRARLPRAAENAVGVDGLDRVDVRDGGGGNAQPQRACREFDAGDFPGIRLPFSENALVLQL